MGLFVPSRNIVKIDVPDSFYHVYTRGISKQTIFHDDADYLYLLSLFERYLSKDIDNARTDATYQKLYDSIEVLAYCLMPNHFHLLVYQIDKSGMSRLMHNIMTSYSRYFNTKYKRSGPLFESRYKASRIEADKYLLHISRYIHLNPDCWIEYPYSSLRAYLYDDVPCWMNKNRVSELYESTDKYYKFLEDYNDRSEVDSRIASSI